ncbi:MAG: zinc ribbon domain-containing protein [Firmicutes bacterium]|nr:zinc ribbon domain-containing protein [Bacillota bacterium]
MADFFEKLMEDAKKAAAKVADRTLATANIAKAKAQETMDIVKIEIEMKKVQGNLDKEYQVLGQLIYQIEMGTMNQDDNIILAACKRITGCIEQLDELEAKKQAIKNGTAAEETEEAEVVEGEEAEELEVPAQEPEFEGYEEDEEGYPMMQFCPHCKAGNTPDAKVCVNCHKPL